MATKFFAVTDANGLISQELNSDNKSDAIREVKAAVDDKAATDWINDAQTDIEDELSINCDGLSFSAALERCHGAGAEFVWGEQNGDSWDIWSVESD